ncbi:MAG: hypothetical protein CYPHOPRED_003145 [Cyphobasidiales sp. Tagirdzhanova-0007]|nr:MAG: hypothetical protein CYPHOPRED_003145 [Cyphobasidiales sp. Tagirdzhanova-0007]
MASETDWTYSAQADEARRGSQALLTGSEDWRLLSDIMQPRQHIDIVLPKNTYDAFVNTGLEAMLREGGVARTVILGVVTNMCCETTARSSFCRGFHTYFVSDAVGSDNVDIAQGSLKALALAFGPVVTTKEMLEIL